MGSESTRQRRRSRKAELLLVDTGYDGSSSSEGSVPQIRIRLRRRRRKVAVDAPPEEHFGCLVLRVATALALVCVVTFTVYQKVYPSVEGLADGATFDDDDDVIVPQVEEPLAKYHTPNDGAKPKPIIVDKNLANLKAPQEEPHPEELLATIPPLPVWNLTNYAIEFDAFALAEKYHPNTLRHDNVDSTEHNNNNALFWQAAAGLREQFAGQYGGENAARALLERGITVFGRGDASNNKNDNNRIIIPDDLQLTACRIRKAKREARAFRFAFGGYSVTAGRGNLFRQSFPLVMEQQLHTVFQLMGVELTVRNAAVGGCPSFPYGFCMANFWGEAPDVVSWDYSMNEAGGDPVSLEAYLRHVMSAFGTQPKLIVKDTHMAVDRRNLLQHYYNHASSSALPLTARDPMVIHTDPAARPFLDRLEAHRPVGFQEWRKFGAPPGAPGQSLHHPAVKEHELIAWLMTMHFLSALEILAASENMHDADAFLLQQCKIYDDAVISSQRVRLLEPVYEKAKNSSEPWLSILFGEPLSDGKSDSWKISDVQCRTSFEPIIAGNLSDIVVSGSVGEDLDVMLPKSKMFYNSGWVLDLSDEEKKAKRNLNRFGGLGFVDSKKAYYGIFASGTLSLLLPYDATDVNRAPSVGDLAKDWFKSVVICEVNEKRGVSACNMKDVYHTVGGVNATNVSVMDAAGALYLGKKLCTHILVPDAAVLTSRVEIGQDPMRAPKIHDVEHGRQVGLLVTVTIHNNHINRREEACSISHVVWEHRPVDDESPVDSSLVLD